ncbi:hypothetical protein [Demequina rhizosphaerae]|uniref:hypothetical protein n=1 Tax=Demequina rhizosphaerae TaxID=1638985 RepID=UPI00078604B2|nr:hypothetical protein [Demequina rhizosphaerae]
MRGITSMRLGTGALVALGVLAYVFGGQAAWILLLLGAALAGLVVWEYVEHARHRDEVARFALEHGWSHTPRTAKYSLRFTGTPFDQRGSSVRQEDVLEGRYGGVPCATFTHVVEQQSDGERSSAQVFQVTLAELPVRLPRLDIVPEHVGHHLAQAFGGVDIEVESHAFNSRWRVIARDRRYGHDVVDPRMIERLLAYDVEGCSLRIDGGAVLMWSPGREGVDTLAKRLDVVAGVARRIPDHVLRRYAQAGAAMRDPDAPLAGPAWATTPGVLNSRRYTGIGSDEAQQWTATDPEPEAGPPRA